MNRSHEGRDGMATNTKTVNYSGGSLNFLVQDGYYSIVDAASKWTQIYLEGGETTNITDSAFERFNVYNFGETGAHLTISADLIGSGETTDGDGYINITGVTFREADENGGNFTADQTNIYALVNDLIDDHPHDMAYVIERLSINAGKTDAFKVVWDVLDARYQQQDYYNGLTNEQFVRLGVEYIKYLEAGGEPLTFIVAKYTADGGDPGEIADRLQSMHDNLLGNATTYNIENRGFGPETVNDLKDLLATVPAEYADRAIYSGNESALSGAEHDGVRVFDYAQGFDRPDYVEDRFGMVDEAAQKPGTSDMIFGTGNSADNFLIETHVGAGLELGLKIKERGPNGGDYTGEDVTTGADGVLTYHVDSGPNDGSANRADWSFDWSIVTGLNGANTNLESFTYKLEFDVDPTAGVEYVDLFEVNPAAFEEYDTAFSAQNSFNYGFLPPIIDSDGDGVAETLYDFSAATFNVRLSAFDTAGELAQVEVRVVVGDGLWNV